VARRSGSMSAGGLPQSTRVPACLSPTEPEYALPVQAETSPERQMQSVRVSRLCAGNKHTCATGGRVEGRWPCPLKRDVASGPADIAALCSPRHFAEGDQLCVWLGYKYQPALAQTHPPQQKQSVSVSRCGAGNKHTCAMGPAQPGGNPPRLRRPLLKRDVASSPCFRREPTSKVVLKSTCLCFCDSVVL